MATTSEMTPEILEAIKQGRSIRSIAREFHVDRDRISIWIREQKDGTIPNKVVIQSNRAERAGIEIKPNCITIIGDVDKTLTAGDIKGLLERRGLVYEDWKVEWTTVNEWTTPAVINGEWSAYTNHQLKVVLRPTNEVELLRPARTDGYKFKTPKPPKPTDTEILVALPDQQIPWYDERLHDCVLQVLQEIQPHRMVLSGDFFDLPSASTHPRKAHERTDGRMQVGLDTGYIVGRDYVEAAGKRCYIKRIVPGNHEHRFQKSLMQDNPEFYDLYRAGDPGTKVLSLDFLSRLDELGFVWEKDPIYEEHYPYAHYKVNDELAIYHGWVVKEDAGASGLKSLDRLGHSIAVGHTHRMGIVPKTVYDTIEGHPRVLYAIELGTLARVEGGLGHTMHPNWQQGFGVFFLHPDGSFEPTLAYYRDNRILWQGRQYKG